MSSGTSNPLCETRKFRESSLGVKLPPTNHGNKSFLERRIYDTTSSVYKSGVGNRNWVSAVFLLCHRKLLTVLHSVWVVVLLTELSLLSGIHSLSPFVFFGRISFTGFLKAKPMTDKSRRSGRPDFFSCPFRQSLPNERKNGKNIRQAFPIFVPSGVTLCRGLMKGHGLNE